MSTKKSDRVSHLDAEQGAGEKRPQAYIRYAEDVSQPSNTVLRQKHTRASWLGQLLGVCDG